MEGNNLTGPFPEVLANLPNLVQLKLSNNKIQSLPPTVGNISSTTSEIYLDSNAIVGSIPPELGKLKSLQLLMLSNNLLSESIPDALSGMSSMRYLYLSGNQLSGHIPNSFCNMNNLTVLSLSNNNLSGEINSIFSNLTSLEKLLLSNNKFSGDFPFLGRLPNLSDLDLSNNNFRGTFSNYQDNPGYLKLSACNLFGNPLLCIDEYNVLPNNCTGLQSCQIMSSSGTSARTISSAEGNLHSYPSIATIDFSYAGKSTAVSIAEMAFSHTGKSTAARKTAKSYQSASETLVELAYPLTSTKTLSIMNEYLFIENIKSTLKPAPSDISIQESPSPTTTTSSYVTGSNDQMPAILGASIGGGAALICLIVVFLRYYKLLFIHKRKPELKADNRKSMLLDGVYVSTKDEKRFAQFTPGGEKTSMFENESIASLKKRLGFGTGARYITVPVDYGIEQNVCCGSGPESST